MEEILGRSVVAFMGDIDTAADLAMVAFVLKPPGDDAGPGRGEQP